MASIHKKVGERFKIIGDFTSVLRTELLDIDECTVTAVDRNDDDATADVVVTNSMVIVGGKIHARIYGGDIDLAPYVVTISAVTTLDSCWQLDIIINIDE